MNVVEQALAAAKVADTKKLNKDRLYMNVSPALASRISDVARAKKVQDQSKQSYDPLQDRIKNDVIIPWREKQIKNGTYATTVEMPHEKPVTITVGEKIDVNGVSIEIRDGEVTIDNPTNVPVSREAVTEEMTLPTLQIQFKQYSPFAETAMPQLKAIVGDLYDVLFVSKTEVVMKKSITENPEKLNAMVGLMLQRALTPAEFGTIFENVTKIHVTKDFDRLRFDRLNDAQNAQLVSLGLRQTIAIYHR